MPTKSQFNPAIHSTYRAARIQTGASLRALAKKSGISHVHLHEVEHGRRRLSPRANDKWEAAVLKMGEKGKK